MADLLTMMLVACDSRRNPVIKVAERQVSATVRAVSKLIRSASSGVAALGSTRDQGNTKKHTCKSRKYQTARKYETIKKY